MIINENINICIIGLGYVGLSLAVEFGKKYRTTGYDISEKRVKEVDFKEKDPLSFLILGVDERPEIGRASCRERV